jgi:hypothetical protein
MKKFQSLILIIIFITSVSCSSLPNDSTILLQSIHVFDAESEIMSEASDILIVGNKIKTVKLAGSGMEASQVIDCSGKYIIPGLFDCHTHLSGLTLMGGDTLKHELSEFVHQGVLHTRDVGGPIGVISKMNKNTISDEMLGPEIFYTGPMLESSPLTWEDQNKDLPGFMVAVNNKEDVDKLIPTLVEHKASMIKTFGRISIPIYQYLIKSAQQQGLKVVHDPGAPLFNWVPIDKAIEFGITSIEHAKAPWPYVLNDELKEKHDAATGPKVDPKKRGEAIMLIIEAGMNGISEERLKDLATQMIENKVFLCPTLYVQTAMAESEHSDENAEEDENTIFRNKMVTLMNNLGIHFVQKLSEYGVKMLVGQDNRKPEGTLEEMKLMEKHGVSTVEVLKGATIYPAQWLGVDSKYGSVEPNKIADLVILNANPLDNIANVGEIFMVIQRGVIIDK